MSDEFKEQLKCRLTEYVQKNGIKMLHLSKETETGIPDYMLCKFKYGKADLNKDSLIKLDEYLRSKGA